MTNGGQDLQRTTEPLTGSGQAAPVDFLAELLRRGKAPTLDMLLALAPDEQLGPPEGIIMVQKRGAGWVVGRRKRWTKDVFALRKRYPGYQPGYHFQEEMRYGRLPPRGATLREWVVTLINHAKVAWYRAIDAKRTKSQFAEFLPIYLEDDLRCWRAGSSLDEANQILRIACGLPRFYRQRKAG